MVLNTAATCLMAYSSDYEVPYTEYEDFVSPLENSYEWVLQEHKVINQVYDVYLFFIRHNMAYIAYICSKDAKGEPIGWQILEYPIAVKIFPILKDHKEDYAEFISS